MVCTNCVLDSSVKEIVFDERGVCNYCIDYASKKKIFKTEKDLAGLINKHKNQKKYDCIVGISGGLDSSYLLYKVKELGLNALAVTVDSGWNTEIATSNIET